MKIKQINETTLRIKDEIILIFKPLIESFEEKDDPYRVFLKLVASRERKIKKNSWRDSLECSFQTLVHHYPELKELCEQMMAKKMMNPPLKGEMFDDYSEFINYLRSQKAS